MAWTLFAKGTPAQLVTQINALVSGTLSALEVAEVARAKTALLAEVNSFAANQVVELRASGGQNIDGSRFKVEVDPISLLTTDAFVYNSEEIFPTPP
jgi:hypothetical protein